MTTQRKTSHDHKTWGARKVVHENLAQAQKALSQPKTKAQQVCLGSKLWLSSRRQAAAHVLRSEGQQ